MTATIFYLSNQAVFADFLPEMRALLVDLAGCVDSWRHPQNGAKVSQLQSHRLRLSLALTKCWQRVRQPYPRRSLVAIQRSVVLAWLGKTQGRQAWL